VQSGNMSGQPVQGGFNQNIMYNQMPNQQFNQMNPYPQGNQEPSNPNMWGYNSPAQQQGSSASKTNLILELRDKLAASKSGGSHPQPSGGPMFTPPSKHGVPPNITSPSMGSMGSMGGAPMMTMAGMPGVTSGQQAPMQAFPPQMTNQPQHYGQGQGMQVTQENKNVGITLTTDEKKLLKEIKEMYANQKDKPNDPRLAARVRKILEEHPRIKDFLAQSQKKQQQ